MLAFWYKPKKTCLAWLLLPLSFCFRLVVFLRRWLYRRGFFSSYRFDVPVIVIGNISVGGTGKTPLVIYIAKQLQARGLAVAIVSRGYGGRQKTPAFVTPDSTTAQMGDEPMLIAKQAQCPVVVAASRVAAVNYLLKHQKPDVILSDDGLQHYALQRQVEVAVVDAARGLGNGLLLPAGPLREPKQRLRQVDVVVLNGGESSKGRAYAMTLKPLALRAVQGDGQKAIADCHGLSLHAMAGIGNPERFFNTLTALGLQYIAHVFPDHYAYKAQDIDFTGADMVVMTEKDSVKCQAFADARHWYLPVEAVLPAAFMEKLIRGIQ